MPIYLAPASTNEPTVDHEPSVSAAARRPPSAGDESRSSRDSTEHGGIIHQLLPQTSSSRQGSFHSPGDAAVAAKDDDDTVGGRAAACVVIGTVGGGEVAALTTPRDTDVVAVDARPAAAVAPRWSDRRECPPWRANSLENIVPENLPRPSARRMFNSVKRAPRKAPALGPQAVAPPFLALGYGVVSRRLHHLNKSSP